MTWVLQAAVVLAVPLTLLGAVKAGALVLRKVREDREGAAMAADLLFSRMPGISGSTGWWTDQFDGFRDWLADKIDGTSSDGDSSGFDASSDGDGGTTATSAD
ncbi:hypothetical protein [Cystobacter fuscus]|uniref:hypothetical protein n=1 Tax=Cystobacter fuscus TaxID=43 RepID=UPI002B2F3A68|nr:hypothetical protein F0U63_46835 [Cystobacter fuscus]